MEENVFYVKDQPNLKSVNFEDKDSLIRFHYFSMLNRTNAMFEYDGIEKTMSTRRYLETNLQLTGYMGFIKHEGKFYYTWGQLGDIPNYEYVPTQFIVTNPYLVHKRYKVIYDINDEIDGNIEDYAVVIPNDPLFIGLRPILSYYSQMAAENDISKRLATINLRAFYMITAGSDKENEQVKAWINDLKNGKLGSVHANAITNMIQTLPYADKTAAQTLTNLIEDKQYIKASYFNELGLMSNYNMKRESINSNEAQLNEDSLVPLIKSMENCRKEAHELIKKFFEVDINVHLASVWEETVKQAEGEVDKNSNQLENEEKNNNEEENGVQTDTDGTV